MKGAILLFILLLPVLNRAEGQTDRIGQKFPFADTILVNGKHRSLEHLRGQPLIIEFFSSTCIVCFRMMPKINKLQQMYKDRLTFLLIGDETKKLPVTYARFKEKFNLTMQAGFDSALFSSFNPPSVPRYIWIDANGRIRAETGLDEITPSNLDAFLTAGNIELPQVKRKYFSGEVLLQPSKKDAGTDFIYRSLFTGPIDTLESFYPRTLEFSEHGPFFQVINCRMEDLYQYAYFGKSYWSAGDSLYGRTYSELVIEGESTFSLTGSSLFCYSVSFSSMRPREVLQNVLRSDLQNNFGYYGELETRNMPYWALVLADKADRSLRSKASKKSDRSSYTGLDYQNVNISALIRRLDYTCKSSLPYLDETGIDYPIDISFEAIMTDFDDVRKALASKGLLLVKKEKPMQVLVLRPVFKNVAAK